MIKVLRNKSYFYGINRLFSQFDPRTNSKFHDVVKFNTDERGHFVNLPSFTLELNHVDTIFLLQQKLAKDSGNPNTSIRFFNSELIEFSSNTPLALIFVEDFYICINQEEFYAVVVEVDDPFLQVKVNWDLNHDPIFKLAKDLSLPETKIKLLARFVSKILDALNVQAQNTTVMDKKLLNIVLREIILDNSLFMANQLNLMDAKLSFLKEKLLLLNEQKKDIMAAYEKKAKRRINFIYSFLFSQMFITQYGTYIKYSWDIMEPITCLFGILDIIIAYSFWLATNKEYNFEEVKSNFLEKKEKRLSMKGKINLEEIDQVMDMIKSLEEQRLLYSQNKFDVYKAINGNIFELKEDLKL